MNSKQSLHSVLSNRSTVWGTHLQRNMGFTLIELMTTLTIIGLLASLLLSAVFTAKTRTHQMVCSNSLRQLIQSWQMYPDDHQGRLPESFFFEDGRIPGRINTNAWIRGSMDPQNGLFPRLNREIPDSINPDGIRYGSLFSYNRSEAVYRCPADRSQIRGKNRVRSYTMNGWIGGYPVAGQDNFRVMHHQSDLYSPAPANLWVLIDEAVNSIDDGWFGVDMIGRRGLIDMPTDRHAGGYNLTFADGHIEIRRLRDKRSRNWKTLPVSNAPPNEDWFRLKSNTTAPGNE